MASAIPDQRRDHVVSVLCGVLDLWPSDKRSRLLHLISTNDEVRESVESIERICDGPLKPFTADELKVAGKLKLHDVPEATLTSSDSWLKLMSLAESKNNYEEVVEALIDHNIECGSIANAFRTQASRYHGGDQKFWMASIDGHEGMKKIVETFRTHCTDLETEFQDLEVHFTRYLTLSDTNAAVTMLASRHPEFGDSENHVALHQLCRQRQVFDETISPHDHILTKLQALGTELNLGNARDNSLVSDARCYASEVVWSFFQNCRRALDHVYIEACSTGRANLGNAPSHARAVEEERRAILEEIQSLWDEVVPVAHMAVEQEFLKPFLSTVKRNDKDLALRNATISAYTSGVLRYMNQHMKVIADRFYILILHHNSLFDAYQFALARTKGDPILDLPKSILQQPALPEDNRSSVIELLQGYLAKYGSIPIDLDFDHPRQHPNEQAVTKLQEFVANRNGKLSAMYAQMQTLFEAAAKANLGNVEIGRAILSRRIVADGDSGFDNLPRSVHKDDEAEEAIQLMEDEVEAVRERFRRLDMSGAAEAPDFVLQAYLKAHKRLAAKTCEGCLTSGNGSISCPACRGCVEFTDFISRWGEA